MGAGDREQGGPDVVSVLVVDDQDPFREAMRELVEATDGFGLIGEAASGEQALAAAADLRPQLVLMDKRMPGMGGDEASRLITRRHPNVVVVIVSVEEPSARVLESSGAAAVIRKQDLSPRRLRDLWREHGREVEGDSRD